MVDEYSIIVDDDASCILKHPTKMVSHDAPEIITVNYKASLIIIEPLAILDPPLPTVH